MAVTVGVEGDFLIYRWETEVIHPTDFPWTSEVVLTNTSHQNKLNGAQRPKHKSQSLPGPELGLLLL